MTSTTDKAISSTENSSTTSLNPRTARGEKTRAALVDATRTVFERDGYLESRLTDITAEAGCSTGTFYTYFTSKEEIFAALMEATKNEMLNPGHLSDIPREDASEPAKVIEASNRAYFTSYQRNAKLMALMEQVAMVDAEFKTLRQQRAKTFFDRNARSIVSLQERGLVDDQLDPELTSRALSGMTSRLAYANFATHDTNYSLEALTTATTRLWCNALGLSYTPTISSPD